MNQKQHRISLKQQYFNASTDTPHIPSQTITLFRFLSFLPTAIKSSRSARFSCGLKIFHPLEDPEREVSEIYAG